MKYSILVVAALFITGCSNVATNHRPESYYPEQGTSSSSDTSFFGDSAEGLDEKAIQKILSYRLALPSHSRVAILNLSQNNYWRRYSNDFILLDAETVKGLVGNLNDSPRIYDASFLPSLLIPEKKTLTHLRIAAARYQADMLLAYRSNCQSFEKYKFIDPNVTKAYCSVEAVALDVRSGIVPFTAVSTNEFTAEKKEDDVNFQETRRKAEMNAIKIGLTEISSRLRRFIEAMPKLTHKP